VPAALYSSTISFGTAIYSFELIVFRTWNRSTSDFLSCCCVESTHSFTLIIGWSHLFLARIKEIVRLDADTEVKEIQLALDRVMPPYLKSILHLLLLNGDRLFKFNGIVIPILAASFGLPGRRLRNRTRMRHLIHMFKNSFARILAAVDQLIPPIPLETRTEHIAPRA